MNAGHTTTSTTGLTGRTIAAITLSVAVTALCPHQASAALLYEPSSYAAQDNLILHLDGIRNVGALKAHDGNASEWIDLANGNTVTFDTIGYSESTYPVTSEWAADGYVFGGGAYGTLTRQIDVGNVFTIQIVTDFDHNDKRTTWPTPFGAANDQCNIYARNDSDKVTFNTKGVGGATTFSGWEGRYLTALYNKGGRAFFQTVDGSAKAGENETSVGSRTYYVGAVIQTSDYESWRRSLDGTIKAIRVYNTVLSQDQLKLNREIDEARFFGGIPVTNVVVASSVEGLEGREGSGAYAIDEDGYTFTAPGKASKDGSVHVCSGYTLETWNGEEWSDPVFNAATTYTATDTSAKVRLTWRWRYAHGEKTTDLDPLFDNYVTDGLVLHLDGIRNAGRDLPHDYTSGRWIDLVDGKIAEFRHDLPDASGWKDDGYFFGGRSYAEFLTQLTGLTNTVTVQVVCETTVDALATLKAGYADANIYWPTPVGCNNDDTLNIYYNFPRADGQLTFKNTDGGNVFLTNTVWEGRYATAIRDGDVNYIFQSTDIADAVSGTSEPDDIGNAVVRIGSSCDTIGKRRQRWFFGKIKSVRIYDRVLSNEELAQNRAIDEVRFFGAPAPVVNVTVASDVRGISGDVPEGDYALSEGGHVFTAPANVTAGEDTYECTGYTLETWNGSEWGDPVGYEGRSCTLSDLSARVRLTWKWSHTSGPGYDASFNGYVTDGLVLHLDGVRNAGPQAAHDGSAPSWTDLAVNGGAARIVANGSSGWRRDGCFFDGRSETSYAVMNATRTLDGPYTVQEVLDFEVDATLRLDTRWPMLVSTTETSDRFSLFLQQNKIDTPFVQCKILGTDTGFRLSGWNGEYMNVRFDGSRISVFPDLSSATWNDFTELPGERTFTFASGEGGSGSYKLRSLTGTIKAARIYDRVLTDDEIARNRAIDEVRFFGRAPAEKGMLIVKSTVDGLGGNLPCGVYSPAAGYEFTAGTSAMLDGVPYELKGYSIETWNGSAWTVSEEGDGASAVPDVSEVSKRLTWNWAVKSRITEVSGYDVDDYVQDGLYLHLDGIRNAGAEAEHDPDATVWANLSALGSSLDGVFGYASSDTAGDGWEADGYRFKYGGKFVGFNGNLKLPKQVTIQVVCKAENSSCSWPHYFGAKNDLLNIYGGRNPDNVIFKIFNNKNNGGWQKMTPWDGEYISAIWHMGKYQIFQSEIPDPAAWLGTWRIKDDADFDDPFYIGGVYKESDPDYVNGRRLTGKIQAVRVYTRSLSDEELAHNRKIDNARFKGVLPDWNVEISAGKFEASTESAGHYLVEGFHTFTAEPAYDAAAGKTRPAIGCIVETWDETEKAWTGATMHRGDSYTHAGGGKVRITWKWRPDGTVILFR